MKRIRPRTDIPDWRDPNMPVCRHYTFVNGTVKTIIDPDFETRYRAHQMIVMDTQLTSWKDDPTYFGRKDKCPTAPASNDISTQTLSTKSNQPATSNVSARPEPSSVRALDFRTADINEMLRDVRAKLFSR